LGRGGFDAPAGGAFLGDGVFGGYLIGVVFIGVDEGAFWSQMQASVDFRFDVWNGIVKSFVFGVAVSLIAVFEGYDAVPTAEGVSSAIKSTVVKSALAILALDFVLTSFMFRGLDESQVARFVGRDFRRRSGFASLLFLALKVGNLVDGQFFRDVPADRQVC
jgi:hypothetical protein